MLVVYAGDNDLADGSSPEAVLDHLGAIIRRKRASLGAIPMAYVSIKISPARFFIMHKIAYTNRIIERALAAEDEVEYVDITRRMIGRGMAPLLEYYSDDPLHMNRDGYRVLGKSLADYLAAVEGHGDLRVRPAECEPAWCCRPMTPTRTRSRHDDRSGANTPGGRRRRCPVMIAKS